MQLLQLCGLNPVNRDISHSLNNRFNTIENTMQLQTLLLSSPTRIDVGAFYLDKHSPKSRQALAREFFVDVDFSHFCEQCDKAKKLICKTCWNRFMVPMIVFLQDLFVRELRTEPNDIHFFFSGGKGFHCWIFRGLLLFFTSRQRSLLANTINRKLEKFMEEKHLLSLFTTSSSSSSMTNDELSDRHQQTDVLDTDVTSSITHTIRMPFSVHDRTGLLCAPLDLTNLNFENCVFEVNSVDSATMQMLVERLDHLFL